MIRKRSRWIIVAVVTMLTAALIAWWMRGPDILWRLGFEKAAAREKFRRDVGRSKPSVMRRNVPIRFYGRVVDQNTNGVADVAVYAATSSITVYERKETKLELHTDSQGLFEVDGGKGEDLTISMKKTGYRAGQVRSGGELIGGRYDYSGGPGAKIHHPDPNNPVVFYIWKEMGSNPLIKKGKMCLLGTESRVYTVDLLNLGGAYDGITEGATSEGDLHVQLKRPSKVEWGDKYEWSFAMDVIDGGVIETQDRFQFLAPESGYQPRYELVMNPSDPQWKPRVQGKTFFLRSRGGKVFALLHVDIFSDADHVAALRIDYLANPAGSRNLEFDPAKKINKQ